MARVTPLQASHKLLKPRVVTQELTHTYRKLANFARGGERVAGVGFGRRKSQQIIHTHTHSYILTYSANLVISDSISTSSSSSTSPRRKQATTTTYWGNCSRRNLLYTPSTGAINRIIKQGNHLCLFASFPLNLRLKKTFNIN